MSTFDGVPQYLSLAGSILSAIVPLIERAATARGEQHDAIVARLEAAHALLVSDIDELPKKLAANDAAADAEVKAAIATQK